MFSGFFSVLQMVIANGCKDHFVCLLIFYPQLIHYWHYLSHYWSHFNMCQFLNLTWEYILEQLPKTFIKLSLDSLLDQFASYYALWNVTKVLKIIHRGSRSYRHVVEVNIQYSPTLSWITLLKIFLKWWKIHLWTVLKWSHS